jgi:hypothetical protein
LRVANAVSLFVQLSNVGSHFQAGEQLGIARFAAHSCFGHAVIPIRNIEAFPYSAELASDRLLRVEAVFLHVIMVCFVVLEIGTALISDALADLLNI